MPVPPTRRTITCPSCTSTNEYDLTDHMVRNRCVCRACGVELLVAKDGRATLYMEPKPPLDTHGALMRLRARVEKYPDYQDRDRDILLVHLITTLTPPKP